METLVHDSQLRLEGTPVELWFTGPDTQIFNILIHGFLASSLDPRAVEVIKKLSI